MVDDRQRFGALTREEASDLLRRRLTAMGGLLGGVMGITWIVVALLVVPGFPDFGSAPFLILLFLSILLLAAAGAYAGRRVWRKNVPGDAT